MKKKQVRFLKELLETPSATGTEIAVARLVRERLADTADEIRTDVMGSVHATLKGAGAGPSLMLSAHMDEIGLMVTYISDEGYLSVASVGGVDAAVLPGMRVDVHASESVEPLRGVVGRKPIHLIEPDERKKVTPLDKLIIDLGLPGKKVRKLVRVGDVITFGVGFERFGAGMAVSRAFDDKAGVWVGVRVLEQLARAGRAPGDFTFAATVQEEIGTRGAETSAYSVRPDVGLAFDVTHATDYPGIDPTKHGKIVCGQGPVIARGPNINPEVFERLVAAAEAEGLPYQLEAEPGVTGTDARAIQMARGGIPTGLVSVPLRYMHTPTEVVCLADLDATVKLVVRFARDLGGDACFVPGMAGASPLAREEAADDAEPVRRDGRGVAAMKREASTIAKNKKAFHEYDILETYEAGIELTGTEVRSLRENHCQLTDCFALVRDGEVWLHNVHIPPYANGNLANPDPDRKRKLLLHKRQIRLLREQVKEKGMALVPLKMYFKENSLVKVELGVARGKKLHDKRATMAERDSRREIERALKERSR